MECAAMCSCDGKNHAMPVGMRGTILQREKRAG
jgi:hypothetical protein